MIADGNTTPGHQPKLTVPDYESGDLTRQVEGVALFRANGSTSFYEGNIPVTPGSGNLPIETSSSLIRTAGGYEIVHVDQSRELYNDSGIMTGYVDSAGNQTTIVDTGTQLIVTDPFGQRTRISLSNPSGPVGGVRERIFTYDYPADRTATIKHQYQFNAVDGRWVSDSLEITHVDPDGADDPFTTDVVENPALALVEVFDHDALGRLSTVTSKPADSVTGIADTRTVQFNYRGDSYGLGQVSSITISGKTAGGGSGTLTSLHLDAYGLQAGRIDGAGGATLEVHDRDTDPIDWFKHRVNVDQVPFNTALDETLDRVAPEFVWTQGTGGSARTEQYSGLAVLRDGNGNRTVMQLDRFGRVTATIDEHDQKWVTERRLDLAADNTILRDRGEVIQVITPDPDDIGLAHVGDYAPLLTSHPTPGEVTVSGPLSELTTRYAHDNNSFVISTQLPALAAGAGGQLGTTQNSFVRGVPELVTNEFGHKFHYEIDPSTGNVLSITSSDFEESWHNPRGGQDVNEDGTITALDALRVI
ncbi:MAG: hypothetical protein MI861_20325, partial [Pirellulales bacterium]|nr:hypothetical protein [Pirellulales bacterium]